MALIQNKLKNGIQFGKVMDKCSVCEKEARAQRQTLQPGQLDNKECFILNINGLRHCLCMDHFQELLGDYVLINGNDLTDDEVITLDAEELEQAETKEEVEALIEKEVSNKNAKSKASKPSKGK